jgi:hypothetical protein
MMRNELRQGEGACRGHLDRFLELHLGAHQQPGHILTDRHQQPLEQQESLLLIFVDRLLLRIAAEVNDGAQRIERRQMLLPVMVERLEQDILLDLDLFALCLRLGHLGLAMSCSRSMIMPVRPPPREPLSNGAKIEISHSLWGIDVTAQGKFPAGSW